MFKLNYGITINIPHVIQSITEANQRIIAILVNQLDVWKFKIVSNSSTRSFSAPEDLIRAIPLSEEERWLKIGDRLIASILWTALKFIIGLDLSVQAITVIAE